MHNRFSASAAILFILVVSGLPILVQAASPLSLGEALAIADRGSSLLAAQRSAIAAAVATTATARGLAEPSDNTVRSGGPKNEQRLPQP